MPSTSIVADTSSLSWLEHDGDNTYTSTFPTAVGVFTVDATCSNTIDDTTASGTISLDVK